MACLLWASNTSCLHMLRVVRSEKTLVYSPSIQYALLKLCISGEEMHINKSVGTMTLATLGD